ncbi:MAG: hypothetical protein GF334_08855, partial [Candidatus Altiarchaeales archaeon]|nr:hypothetical protein [Candidatus Altiarchaeales archaeon]
MSGGHFDYEQGRIRQAAEEVEAVIAKNNEPDEYGDCYEFPEPILAKFR